MQIGIDSFAAAISDPATGLTPKINETRNAQGPPNFPHTCQIAGD